jgi:hypothetical protein
MPLPIELPGLLFFTNLFQIASPAWKQPDAIIIEGPVVELITDIYVMNGSKGLDQCRKELVIFLAGQLVHRFARHTVGDSIVELSQASDFHNKGNRDLWRSNMLIQIGFLFQIHSHMAGETENVVLPFDCKGEGLCNLASVIGVK